MSELPVSTLMQIVFGDNMDLDSAEDLDAQPNLMDDFILRNQVQAAVKSANGASAVFDLALPPESDVDDDDAPLYKAPRIVLGVSNALLRTGDHKFVKVLTTIRRVFDGHEEEMAEAIEIATRIRSEARAEAIASA
jgi:hypothetical protein